MHAYQFDGGSDREQGKAGSKGPFLVLKTGDGLLFSERRKFKMKKILFLGIGVICILFLSCQEAQPPEGKKEAQVKKEEVKQPQAVEPKSEDQLKQQAQKPISQEP
jgi:hypothetical protein